MVQLFTMITVWLTVILLSVTVLLLEHHTKMHTERSSIDCVYHNFATTPGNVFPLLGKIICQYGTQGHFGTIKELTAAISCACCNALGAKYIGRHHQLFSPCLLQQKCSLLLTLGFKT